MDVAATFTPAQAQFMRWLKNTHPQLFNAMKAHVTAAMPSQLGATTTTSGQTWWQQAISALPSLATTYLGFTSQQQILKTQMQRAQQGLPPLNTSQYSAPVQVQVSGSAGTNKALTSGIASGLGNLKTPLMIGGIAIVAFMFMGKKKRG